MIELFLSFQKEYENLKLEFLIINNKRSTLVKKHELTTTDSFVATVVGAIYSFVNDFQQHIDLWEVGQAVLCSVLTYAAIRLIRAIFPEKPKKEDVQKRF